MTLCVQLQDNMERQYKIMWKDDFVSYLKDSPYAPLDKSAKTERPVNSNHSQP